MNEPGCSDPRCSDSPLRSGNYVQKQIIQDKISLNYSCAEQSMKALMRKKKMRFKKKCELRDSNARGRTHDGRNVYYLNVTP